MGKRLEDLKLDDQPLATNTTDMRDTDWYRFIREVDDLLATGEYTWAETTLTDIQATVEKTQRVTEGQERALQNIREGAGRSRRRSSEGFRRRWW